MNYSSSQVSQNKQRSIYSPAKRLNTLWRVQWTSLITITSQKDLHAQTADCWHINPLFFHPEHKLLSRKYRDFLGMKVTSLNRNVLLVIFLFAIHWNKYDYMQISLASNVMMWADLFALSWKKILVIFLVY